MSLAAESILSFSETPCSTYESEKLLVVDRAPTLATPTLARGRQHLVIGLVSQDETGRTTGAGLSYTRQCT